MGRAVQEEGYLTFEDGTGRLSRNVGNGLRCVKSLRSEEIIYKEACNHGLYTVNSQDNRDWEYRCSGGDVTICV